jgi:hypothetical protein
VPAAQSESPQRPARADAGRGWVLGLGFGGETRVEEEETRRQEGEPGRLFLLLH